MRAQNPAMSPDDAKSRRWCSEYHISTHRKIFVQLITRNHQKNFK